MTPGDEITVTESMCDELDKLFDLGAKIEECDNAVDRQILADLCVDALTDFVNATMFAWRMRHEQ